MFVSAATGVFDERPKDFWELARDAKIAIAGGQTREGVTPLLGDSEESSTKEPKLPLRQSSQPLPLSMRQC